MSSIAEWKQWKVECFEQIFGIFIEANEGLEAIVTFLETFKTAAINQINNNDTEGDLCRKEALEDALGTVDIPDECNTYVEGLRADVALMVDNPGVYETKYQKNLPQKPAQVVL